MLYVSTVWSVFRVLAHLILITTLRDRLSYCLPFTDAKTEHGEVTEHAQGHAVIKWQSQGSDLGSFIPESMCLATTHTAALVLICFLKNDIFFYIMIFNDNKLNDQN